MIHLYRYKIASLLIIALAYLCFPHRTEAQINGVKVIIENMAPDNGTWQTPFWVGFHDGTFDVYNQMTGASEELERFAEDGNFEPLMDSFNASAAGSEQGIIASGSVPPFEPGESAEMVFILDPNDPANRYFSFGSMVLPSNDAFIANDNPMAYQIFDNSGGFLGASFTIYGTEVKDAGTEVNDELPMNTAFFGQMTPNTGVDENGVVHDHPGYLPPGSGGILDSSLFVNADFTQGGYEMARITIIRNDTPVSGNVSGVWNASGSPYLAGGDLTVPAGQTLTIMPGTLVYFPSSYFMTVYGQLEAVGTESDSILFTGSDLPGWYGIRFIGSQDVSHLKYCIIEHGRMNQSGAPYDRGGAVYCDNSSPVIDHCNLSGNFAWHSGGAIYCNQSSAIITNNLIANNDVGAGPGAYGGAIYCYDCQTQIIGNTIVGNNAYGGGYYSEAHGGGIYLAYSDDIISGNLIASNLVQADAYYADDVSGGGIYMWYGEPHILNNTIVSNSAKLYTTPTIGGGIALDPGNLDTYIGNNIVTQNIGGGIYFSQFSQNCKVRYNDISSNDTNFQGEGIPSGLGTIVTVNANGDPCDITYNILLDPQFVNFAAGDYNLQTSSPCVDAGNIASPYDPDGTIADQGTYFFDQGDTPLIEVKMVPENPQIHIPASGGTIDYTISAENTSSTSQNFDVWIMAQLPNGDLYGPLLNANLTLDAGISITRTRSQTIPSTGPQGVYFYVASVGNYPDETWDQDSFIFDKLNYGDGPMISGWSTTGEDFLANSKQEISTEFALGGAYPNPFNPTTTISYKLQVASHTKLTIFDVQGRVVATLVNGYRDAGSHEVTFDASNLASGVYLYKLEANNFSAVGKMMLVK